MFWCAVILKHNGLLSQSKNGAGLHRKVASTSELEVKF
jgi:hypothetical protein